MKLLSKSKISLTSYLSKVYISSLFTSVHLERTVKSIAKRIYNDILVPIIKRKHAMKKLIIGACTKTAFYSNRKIYKEIKEKSEGSLMGPALTNIIRTIKRATVSDLLDQSLLKLHIQICCCSKQIHHQINPCVESTENKGKCR